MQELAVRPDRYVPFAGLIKIKHIGEILVNVKIKS